jgi:hypothetical protein
MGVDFHELDGQEHGAGIIVSEDVEPRAAECVDERGSFDDGRREHARRRALQEEEVSGHACSRGVAHGRKGRAVSAEYIVRGIDWQENGGVRGHSVCEKPEGQALVELAAGLFEIVEP